MEDSSNKLVSVIVVTYFKKNYLEGCLTSIKDQSYPQIETIIIDNSLRNLFYCAALNKGINQSKGDFILCLNDDVILDKRFVEEALKGFNIDERIGMVSGKILRFDRKTIDSTGLFLTFWRTARERGYGLKDFGQYDKEGYIFGVNGAVAFYRREMLEQIKIDTEYFDSDFRIFYEDLDISWRAKNFGWRGYYIPSALAYHLRGGTVRKEKGINKRLARIYLSDELQIDLIKNRYFSIIKNENLLDFLLHLPFIILYDIFLWGYILIFRSQIIRKFLKMKIYIISAFRRRELLKIKRNLM